MEREKGRIYARLAETQMVLLAKDKALQDSMAAHRKYRLIASAKGACIFAEKKVEAEQLRTTLQEDIEQKEAELVRCRLRLSPQTNHAVVQVVDVVMRAAKCALGEAAGGAPSERPSNAANGEGNGASNGCKGQEGTRSKAQRIGRDVCSLACKSPTQAPCTGDATL